MYLVSGQTNAWNTHWLEIGSFAILRCFKIYCKLVFGRFLKFLGKHYEWNHLKTKYYWIKCRKLKIFKSFCQFKMPVINNSHCFAWQKGLWPNIAIHSSRFAQNSCLYQYHIWCINCIRCIISVHDGVYPCGDLFEVIIWKASNIHDLYTSKANVHIMWMFGLVWSMYDICGTQFHFKWYCIDKFRLMMCHLNQSKRSHILIWIFCWCYAILEFPLSFILNPWTLHHVNLSNIYIH